MERHDSDHESDRRFLSRADCALRALLLVIAFAPIPDQSAYSRSGGKWITVIIGVNLALMKLRDVLDAAPIAALWLVARWLPLDVASALGEIVGAIVGPRHRKHSRVLANLRTAFPGRTSEEIDHIAAGVWRNAGAVLAEFPHAARMARTRVEISMPPDVRNLVEQRVPVMFICAHLANWEVVAFVLAGLVDKITFVYSPNKNPLVSRLIQRFRETSNSNYVAKDAALPTLLRAGKEGRSLGLMGDTRADNGAMLSLFGVDSATSIVPARVAQKIAYPVIPVHAKRCGRARFKVEFDPPLSIPDRHDKAAAIHLTAEYHRRLEQWIRDRPTEWWCTKRRWPKSTAAKQC